MFPRFRNLLTNRATLQASLDTPEKSEFLRLVRWRKRRWAPINKSKIFYVRTPTKQDPEEKEELMWRTKHYQTAMKSMRQYIMESNVGIKEMGIQSVDSLVSPEQDYIRRQEDNTAWNEDTRKIREARLAGVEAEKEAEFARILKEKEEKKKQRREQARQRVTKAVEEAQHFVDMDNLEADIEKALNLRTSHSYAIDTEGNRYVEMPDGSTEIKQSGDTPATRVVIAQTVERTETEAQT